MAAAIGMRLDAGAAGQVVARSIHVGPDVRGGRNLRKIARVAVRDLERAGPLERRIAGPSDHAVAQRHGNIDPFMHVFATLIDAPTATTFLTPPGWLFERIERVFERKTPGNDGAQRVGPALSKDAEMLDGRLQKPAAAHSRCPGPADC